MRPVINTPNKMEPIRILILEDSSDDLSLIVHTLRKAGMVFNFKNVETREEYENSLEHFCPDVIISDHSLPSFDSHEALKLFQKFKQKRHPSAVFVLVTGTVSEEFAVKVIKMGADDYILKDRLTRLPAAITGALDKNRILEEKRRVEEEKLHLLDILQKSLNELYIFSSDTLKFKYANDEALRNLGYSLEELQQLNPLDLVEVGKADELKRILQEIEKKKTSRILERYVIRKDKSRYPVQIHLQLIEEHGEKKTFLANVLDITQLKLQEQQKELAFFIQKVFNSDHDLKTCLEEVLEGLCSRKNLQAAGIFTYNIDKSKFTRLASYDAGDKGLGDIGYYLAEMALGHKEPLFYKNLRVLDLPEHLQQEQRFHSAKSYPVLLGGETLAVINFFSETVARSRETFIHLGEGLKNQIANNLKRKRTEEELTKIFEHTPIGLTIPSKDGYFKKVNPYFLEILGYSQKEIMATPFLELVHPEDLDTLLEWEKNIENNEVGTYQNRIKTKSGEYRWFAWSVTPFFEEGLSFAAAMDITEQMNYLEAIENQNTRLAEIAWEQSHVVRAPLARMMGCINALENSSEKREDYLQFIKSSAAELDEIIRSIVAKSEKIRHL